MPANTSEVRSSNIMKTMVVIMGILCVCLVFVIEKLGAVLEMNISLGGVTAGPLLGLFTLGMMFPNSNEKVSLSIYGNKLVIKVVFRELFGEACCLF